MVALAVRFLGQAPVTCAARPLLHRAHTALQRASFIEAGCLLREAARLYLAAEVEYHGVQVSKRKIRRTPRALLDALSRASACGEFQYERLIEIIAAGNRAAHCQFVSPHALGDAISTLHWFLDDAKYLKQSAAAARLEGGTT
jgi:hypothetical protein